MKLAKLCRTITDIMFIIAISALGGLLIGIIQFMNVTVMLQDIANSTAVTTVGTVFLMTYAFAFVLTVMCILMQLLCVVHSFCVPDNLRFNGVLKTCMAFIDVLFSLSFAMETHKFYGYSCLAFCIILLGVSIVQTVVSK